MKFRVVHVLALGLAIVLGGCIKHREPNQQAEQPQIVAADTATYGYPVVEAKVKRCLADYDSLLALKGARQDGPGGKYIATGIYSWSGQYLLEAIDTIEQAGHVVPPDYIGLAELARATFGPRYREFLSFITDEQNAGNGKDQYLLALMGAKYATVLERGLGQATRK
jgi:hypothetical protein